MEKKDINSEMQDLPKRTPMQVPDGYFEKFPRHMQTILSKEDKSRTPLYFPRLAWVGTLVIALFIGLYFLLPTVQNHSTSYELLALVSDEGLIDYLQDNGVDWLELDIEFNDSDLDQFFLFDPAVIEESMDDAVLFEMMLDESP